MTPTTMPGGAVVESKCDTLLYQHTPRGGGFVFWGARNTRSTDTLIKDKASVSAVTFFAA